MIIYIILLQAECVDYLNIFNFEMPIIYIVGRYGAFYKYIYSIIIGIAIYTTAVSSGYGYLQKFEGNKKVYYRQMLFLMLGSVMSVKVGFSKLIELLYPVFGGIGLVQSLCLLKYKDF